MDFLFLDQRSFIFGRGIVFLEERDLRQGGLWQGDCFSFGVEIHIQKAIFFRGEEQMQFFGGSGRRLERLIGLPF